MQIERIFFPLETLGYGKRIGIWTIGCPHACFNCSNPELWDENKSKDLPLSYIYQMLRAIKDPIDGVTISGGEPFKQVEELSEIIRFIVTNITDDILVYSGYTLKQLKNWESPHVEYILSNIAALVDGKYVEEKNDNSPLKGSSNQEIHILNKKYRGRYEKLLMGNRQAQTVAVQDNVLAFGIPLKNTKKTLHQQLPNYGIHMGE
ncbi:anaerobic ribonucleoside-triphosphate reductase activating protein [Ureibacillus xyleni]|uniref:Anaerobic ribonucleoside-triphosphate reductase activating protein n=1 Tax=Ureibacillus xyleni TaxID=614648 RepID=A0A285T376_9BACL|nr:4Fe-4S single cluster domain-containing protein [Ureibacillus xyleni]SOC15766.1 anaerobic ribonucleoside-triphosphate reductase activating protein [Ureibacillus xyleni]